MKNLLFLLVFCAISAHSQTSPTIVTAESRTAFQSTNESKYLQRVEGFYHDTSLAWLDRDEVENKKEIDSFHQSGDTLTIYRKWFLYTGPGGPGAMCLVLGCTSDHKAHFRDRLIFFERSGELEFIRREVGELKMVETTTKSTKWVYQK